MVGRFALAVVVATSLLSSNLGAQVRGRGYAGITVFENSDFRGRNFSFRGASTTGSRACKSTDRRHGKSAATSTSVVAAASSRAASRICGGRGGTIGSPRCDLLASVVGSEISGATIGITPRAAGTPTHAWFSSSARIIAVTRATSRGARRTSARWATAPAASVSTAASGSSAMAPVETGCV